MVSVCVCPHVCVHVYLYYKTTYIHVYTHLQIQFLWCVFVWKRTCLLLQWRFLSQHHQHSANREFCCVEKHSSFQFCTPYILWFTQFSLKVFVYTRETESITLKVFSYWNAWIWTFESFFALLCTLQAHTQWTRQTGKTGYRNLYITL